MAEIGADSETMIANLDAAARFLRERDDVTGRVGTLGWCFGGGVALSYALGGEKHEATAIFYGSLVTDPEILASIDHEVYGSFAEMDNGIPPETVNEFVSALRAAGVENDVHIYDEVNHGFWLRIDGNPELRTEPGLDAWQRLRGLPQADAQRLTPPAPRSSRLSGRRGTESPGATLQSSYRW